jgi:2-polyprenyl-6-hydroxyphenyl methylase/3-demethylubiquinone-9 3-methyltransferase
MQRFGQFAAGCWPQSDTGLGRDASHVTYFRRHEACSRLQRTRISPRAMNEDRDFRAYLALFEPHGTHEDYLRVHYHRYVDTYRRVAGGKAPLREGAHVLDIGAHWLHQSLLYARSGFQVTAFDMPHILGMQEVQSLAQAYAIALLPNADLEHPEALHSLPENSVDIVLFTEVIEHLTFNPIAMWREIYRVLKPGGRIVVTTPNYYALRRLVPHLWRFVRGYGGGVATNRILEQRTFVHHWKEYSLRELRHYFTRLSPDFACRVSEHVEHHHKIGHSSWRDRIVLPFEKCAPFLRPQLYLEIELHSKQSGIAIEPHW